MIKLLQQVSPLEYFLIVNEELIVLLRFLGILFVVLVFTFDDSLEFSDSDVVFVPDPSDFSKLRIFEDSISFTKEIIDQKCELVAWSNSAGPLSILLDQSINRRWNRLIRKVIRILVAECGPIRCQQ